MISKFYITSVYNVCRSSVIQFIIVLPYMFTNKLLIFIFKCSKFHPLYVINTVRLLFWLAYLLLLLKCLFFSSCVGFYLSTRIVLKCFICSMQIVATDLYWFMVFNFINGKILFSALINFVCQITTAMSSLKRPYCWLSKKDLKDLEWFRAKEKGFTFFISSVQTWRFWRGDSWTLKCF